MRRRWRWRRRLVVALFVVWGCSCGYTKPLPLWLAYWVSSQSAAAARAPAPAAVAAASDVKLATSAAGTPYLPYGTTCHARKSGFDCTTFIVDYGAQTYHCMAFHVDAALTFSRVRDFTKSKRCPNRLPHRKPVA